MPFHKVWKFLSALLKHSVFIIGGQITIVIIQLNLPSAGYGYRCNLLNSAI